MCLLSSDTTTITSMIAAFANKTIVCWIEDDTKKAHSRSSSFQCMSVVCSAMGLCLKEMQKIKFLEISAINDLFGDYREG
jgi:hypothetical protein